MRIFWALSISQHLTGGILILRNRYLIILYRGKDFLPDEVADLVEDRERLLRRYQHFEETKRKGDIEMLEVVSNGKQGEEKSKTGTLLEFQELQRKFGEIETKNLETEAEKAKVEKELKSQEHKLSIVSLFNLKKCIFLNFAYCNISSMDFPWIAPFFSCAAKIKDREINNRVVQIEFFMETI